MDELKFLYWNAEGLENKVEELQRIMKKNRISITMVNETHLTSKSRVSIPGYSVYRTDREGDTPYGGTALIIKKNIKHTYMDMKTEHIEATAAKITLSNRKVLKVIAVYKRPSKSLLKTDLETLFAENIPTLVAGDLNSKNMEWGCGKTNQNGRVLKNILQEKEWRLHAPDRPTHIPRKPGAMPDILDIVLTKQDLPDLRLKVINNLNSDHLPVQINLDVINHHKNELEKSIINWKLLSENLKTIKVETSENIEEMVESWKTQMLKAIEKSKKKIYTDDNSRFKISQVTSELIKIRNKIRKDFQKTRDPERKRQLNQIQRLIKGEIGEERQSAWEEKTKKLVAQDNSLWRVTRKLKNQQFTMPPLTTASGIAESDEEKAEALAEALKKQFKPHPSLCPQLHSQLEEEVINYLLSPPAQLPQPITEEEVARTITNLQNNKAPGPDKITNKILKQLDGNHKKFLTHLFNECLKKSHYPSQWKEAEVICLPKPGKNLKSPESYRPISLLNTCGKVFDKIVLARITEIINEKKILPDEQFGFRKGHDTVMQGMRLTEKIVKNFQLKKDTACVLIDVQKAFDSVWHVGLLSKLKKFMPDGYVHLIASFLSGRSFSCRVGDELSTPKTIEASVPQGALWSPTLYALYTADIPKMREVHLGIYADDTSIAVSDVSPEEIKVKLQIYLDELEEWADRWRIKINPDKTTAIYFSKKRNIRYPVLKFGNVNVKWESTGTYLGLTLDSKMTWAQHIAKASNKGKAAQAQLMPLLGKKSKMNLTNKVFLYKAIIRPAMLYGCEIWGGAAKTHLKKLQVLQNKILRCITNAPWFMRNRQLHDDLQVEKIKIYIREKALKLYERAEAAENPEIKNLGDYDPNLIMRCPKVIISDRYLQMWDY